MADNFRMEVEAPVRTHQWAGVESHFDFIEVENRKEKAGWLTDSLVCLHTLSRGRSSSRKLRRTMARVNALVLGGNVQAVWAYVHTDDNPADRPSRWGQRVKTKFRNVKKKGA